jgi:hypothetical protein
MTCRTVIRSVRLVLAAFLAAGYGSWCCHAAAQPVSGPAAQSPVSAEASAGGGWEITPESTVAIEQGLEWLAANQTAAGNWDSNDLGLVGVGTLAFLANGHMPGVGKYGDSVERALSFIVANAKPSGLLNMAEQRRDMYNHGLATFVLGQAYGMTNDPRVGRALDKALKLIARVQGPGGGWGYVAKPEDGDLSLCVMQAKALRSAVDSGLEIPGEVIDRAIARVRLHYHPKHGKRNVPDNEMQQGPGQFTYAVGGGNATVAMAAAGVICLQEFGQYDDWRIPKSMEPVAKAIAAAKPQSQHNGTMPFDAYTLNYVGQSLYQVGGTGWREHYPKLRDCLVASQRRDPRNPAIDGSWDAGAHVNGKSGMLYGTAVAVFVLAIPNRYLPILQEGRIDGINQQFTTSQK